ncbi:MAG: hypothetical protein AB4290_30090 [Spirulina sp.]
MEKLQNQLNVLNDKVDALYQLVETMAHQLNLLLAQQDPDGVAPRKEHPSSLSSSRDGLEIPDSQKVSASTRTITSDETHKDVLTDEHHLDRLLDYNTKERSLSPDLQIRRLTAQVTAAYNRIAALEEQLLAQRNDREEKKLTRPLPDKTVK